MFFDLKFLEANRPFGALSIFYTPWRDILLVIPNAVPILLTEPHNFLYPVAGYAFGDPQWGSNFID